MSLQARTLLNLIAGALGGLLAWILIDLTDWFNPLFAKGVMIGLYDSYWWEQVLIGGIMGGLVGLLLGLVNALGEDSAQQRFKSGALHTVVGFFGGGFGMAIGQSFYGVLAPHSASSDVTPSPGDFVQGLVARSIGWALIGAGVGIAQGVARRSNKLIKQGLFGGLAGGLIGGILFECAASIVQSASFARLLGFMSIGASTGFFIGLIQTLFRQAWIRIVLGRNEGKEYLIDKPVTVIGRSELADIGLFGNPRIMPEQCAIEQIGGRYRLMKIAKNESVRRENIPAEVRVNGAVINPDVWLADGDSIMIDDRTLQFREKFVQRRETPPPSPVQPPTPILPPTLTVVGGPETGRVFVLDGNQNEVGRTDDCEICLKQDTLISRRHATFSRAGGQWSITDNQSANGTFVNGERLSVLSSRELKLGDIVKVGETELKIS